MTKTIGWILMAILNAVITIVMVLDVIDRIEKDMGWFGSGFFAIFFLVVAILWIVSAHTEWKEWKDYIREE